MSSACNSVVIKNMPEAKIVIERFYVNMISTGVSPTV